MANGIMDTLTNIRTTGQGVPMSDPSMMGGAGGPPMGGPPMDPSMMGGPPMGGLPMDPSMMAGAGGPQWEDQKGKVFLLKEMQQCLQKQ